jgi:hypothetical protein
VSQGEPEAPGGPAIPPGTFRIDREGAWLHEGQEVTHPGVLANLYANLRAEGERHYLQVGPRQVAVEVEDTPLVVTRVESAAGAGSGLLGHLTDGSREPVDPAAIWIGARDTPYCRVKAGRFVARLSLAAWLQLAAWLEARGAPLPGA